MDCLLFQAQLQYLQVRLFSYCKGITITSCSPKRCKNCIKEMLKKTWLNRWRKTLKELSINDSAKLCRLSLELLVTFIFIFHFLEHCIYHNGTHNATLPVSFSLLNIQVFSSPKNVALTLLVKVKLQIRYIFSMFKNVDFQALSVCESNLI